MVVFSTAASSDRWVSMAPFGRPVVPDVWMSQAVSRSSAAWASTTSASSSSVTGRVPGGTSTSRSGSSVHHCATPANPEASGASRSSWSAVPMTAEAPQAWSMSACSCGVWRVLPMARTAPALGSA